MTRRGAVVGRLRVADVRGDALATRIAADRALAATTLRPGALPPAAILAVRALRDPRPGTLALDPSSPLPPPEWERALVDALDGLVRRAARPAREPVPAAAEAVLFADRAELLACLARDWLAGVVHACWWWRVLAAAREPEPRRAFVRACADAPAYVPAAFALLAEAREAAAVAAALTADEAETLVALVAAAFGVDAARPEPAPPVDVARPFASPADSPPAAPAIDSAAPARGDGAASPPARPAPPAAARAPAPAPAPDLHVAALVPELWELPLGLRAQRRLLGLALALRRAPVAVRAPAFYRELEQAVRAVAQPHAAPMTAGRAEATRGGSPVAKPPRTAGERAVEEPDVDTAPTPAAPGAGAEHVAPAEPPDAPPRPTRRADHVPARAPAPSVAPAQPPVETTPRAPAPAQPRPTAARAAAPATLHPSIVEPLDTHVEPSTRELGAPTRTGLGGVLFLLNVAIDFGLYGDFTQPANPGIALDPWDFLTLITRRLLDAPDEDDAVWPLLAALAGRDPEATPGEAFLASAGPRWLGAATRRVRSALGAAAVDANTLCIRDSLVHVTDAHVDAVYALADHPLEIRIAGLDRDPGWIPAAGRYVAFHFE